MCLILFCKCRYNFLYIQAIWVLFSSMCSINGELQKKQEKVLLLFKKSVHLHRTSAMAADILGSAYALFPDGEIGHFAFWEILITKRLREKGKNVTALLRLYYV